MVAGNPGRRRGAYIRTRSAGVKRAFPATGQSGALLRATVERLHCSEIRRREKRMAVYKHVLVGLDLSPESRQVMARVEALLGGSDARISLVHVQEPLSFAYGGDIPVDLGQLQVNLETRARERLTALAAESRLNKPECHILIGQPAHEMHRFARENGVDLAVVGSYGRHGLALVFGSTANGVLHGATCDVLAVRIQPEKANG